MFSWTVSVEPNATRFSMSMYVAATSIHTCEISSENVSNRTVTKSSCDVSCLVSPSTITAGGNRKRTPKKEGGLPNGNMDSLTRATLPASKSSECSD